jgi:beta-galactosidase
VTRHDVGQGSGWYLSTKLDDTAHDQVIGAALAAAGLTPEVPGLPAGVAAVRRRSADGRSWLFLLNHTAEPATGPASGVDLLTGAEATGSVALPPGGVAVVREGAIGDRNQTPGHRGSVS